MGHGTSREPTDPFVKLRQIRVHPYPTKRRLATRRFSFVNRQSSIDFASSDPDLMDFSRITDVLQRVAVKKDKIGTFSLLESPKVSGDLQSLGGVRGCRQQCLSGGQSRLHHELQLPMFEESLKT